MSPVSLTLSVNSSTPTTVTLTPVAGLAVQVKTPVKAGTVIGTVTLDKVDVVRGIAIDADDAAKFRVGGKFPNYKIIAAVDIDDGDYAVGVNYLVTGSEIKFTVGKATTEPPPVDPPPVDPPPVTGWPSAKNTGVPAGTTLAPVTQSTKLPSGVSMNKYGEIGIDAAGVVISGLDIRAGVYINANNVTLKNCRMTAGGYQVVKIATGVKGATIQNCEIDGVGTGNDGSHGILGPGTFIANNIHNVENGITLQGSNSVIRDNYIHDLKASGAPHYDGIQIDGGNANVTIEHNTIINDYGQTSAVMIDNYFGPISNITVDNNLLVGGGYTIYVDGHFTGGPITGVSITNNHMGKGQWGITAFNGTSPVYTGNVNDGASLAVGL